MLRRRWWTPLIRPLSPPLSCISSSPSPVSEHSCTVCCSSTCRVTGEHQSPDPERRRSPHEGLTCRGSLDSGPSSEGENQGLKIFSQMT